MPENENPETPSTDEDVKAKFREALARKQTQHGKSAPQQGESGKAMHGRQGQGSKMFRRKSGG